ncbi:casein kinase I homolog KNAG_0F01490 [Huiozyma naganishii CBS 8797]|uniref:non-specific serine/threonine protein kinase n=1 Tax=Huiozyma naganishii (strain ATCC MYA-139 / BCRC 22969 / CBS 8797 / KCTC 17520 / NBRC 10181 / NCYC 3082 / Yp74L-3) TaxID=1071383 RepID=J7RZY3_HUIN7|nr:hypothetical protein KNAG_0F01490 [Kazachstania naganishii CBS 8797]CCK70817.1 hypothetical protein KNAG_0F01490 [Kazachstania naganishii CBS 8797]
MASPIPHHLSLTPNNSSHFQNISNAKIINGNLAMTNNTTLVNQVASPPPSNQSAQNSQQQRDDSTIVGLHYKIGKKIGEGSFGVLFEGVNMINDTPVAIKFEPRKTEAPQLKDEYRAYKILSGTPGIPQAYYFGQEGLHNILVIDLLGPSLEDLFDWCGRRFSVKTVVQCAVQMITLLEDLHSRDLIYRDIKPDNFLVGRQGHPEANNIHLIDFGMAKQYRDPKTKQHIPYREKKSLSGTARYMSINTHLGREQSRRDDMEALGHVFFYFLRGSLPWQGLKAPNNKQKYEKIGEKKRITNVYDLAQGLPIQFGRYLEIVRNLSFEETPDYEGYRRLLLSVLDDLNLSADGEYDWMKLNGGRGYDLTINKKPNLHGYGHPTPPNEKARRHRSKHHQPAALALAAAAQATNAGQMAAGAVAAAANAAVPSSRAGAGAAAGAPGTGTATDENRLDPTSYEAYQQQTQQKYAQQQQQMQQQQQQKNGRAGAGLQQDRNNKLPYGIQNQPNAKNIGNTNINNSNNINDMGDNGNAINRNNHATQTQSSASSRGGFFSKLACC